jgi:hypothetical protein
MLQIEVAKYQNILFNDILLGFKVAKYQKSLA